jgi:2-octaprenyl-6-methoxyphenol hydroxylase
MALNRALLDKSAVEICSPVVVREMRPVSNGMQLQLHAESAPEATSITASLVVLADGGRSGLPAQLGISQQRQEYRQSAVIANVAFTRPHHGRAWERFTPKGPLALLPLADYEGQHRAALVWTHPDNAVDAIMTLDDDAFLAALQQDFGSRVGRFTRVGKRVVFPLALTTADEQIRPGLVLLGNVAHTLHPVAGQGFNLAMRDCMALAENIIASVADGCNPGDFNRLQAYLDEVSPDQLVTTRFSDYMTRMFSSAGAGMTGVRHLGMACIDLLPPLRNVLSRQAMGMRQSRVRLQ